MFARRFLGRPHGRQEAGRLIRSDLGDVRAAAAVKGGGRTASGSQIRRRQTIPMSKPAPWSM